MSYNFDEKISDNNYNCPVVAYYPEVIQNNMELANIPLLSFFIGMQDPKVFEKKIYKYLKAVSYTHLDVYKRQSVICFKSKEGSSCR